MINYTDCLTRLMQDIVLRVPTLSFIDMSEVLVFARLGKLHADGALATCHCLGLPPSEPGYYFWRDRDTGEMTRRSEWFVTKSPVVTIGTRQLTYLISVALPRFCNQSLKQSGKNRFYRRAEDAWIAKLDTVIHELYHIDPDQKAIRCIDPAKGTYAARCHGEEFLEQVAEMVGTYFDTGPDPATYDFLSHPFETLDVCHGGVVGTTFRPYPSYPQRFIERLAIQPVCAPELDCVKVESPQVRRQPTSYTERDLQLRRFFQNASRPLTCPHPTRAVGDGVIGGSDNVVDILAHKIP
jgi:hypothetical protein